MEPQRQLEVTLTDVLDRLLDKGLVLNADVIISVAGIPLIGLTLRAALAGMETMLAYGVMKDWDQTTRAWETKHRAKKVELLLEDERQILKMFGSYWYSEGIYMAWRSGHLYLTDKRIFLYQQDFAETVFQFRLDNIKAMVIRTETHLKNDVDVLYLIPKTDERVIQLKAQDVHQMKQAIEKQIREMGLILEENAELGEIEERALNFLKQGETITHRGKMWHLILHEGVLGDNWRPGYLYLTNKRLCWWYDFDQKILFKVPIHKIVACTQEIRDLSGMLTNKRVLDVIYSNNGVKSVAAFSGKGAEEWDKVIRRVLTSQGKVVEDEIETCPRCGGESEKSELLGKGCEFCGWTSPRLKQQVAKATNILNLKTKAR